MLKQNLRLGLKSLFRQPALIALAVLTLALGIGAVTAITSVVDAVLLRPLPFGQPDRLVAVWESHATRGLFRTHPSPADLVEWRDHAMTFEGVAAVGPEPALVGLTGAGEPRPITVIPTWVNLFEVLGVKPTIQPTWWRGWHRESPLPALAPSCRRSPNASRKPIPSTKVGRPA